MEYRYVQMGHEEALLGKKNLLACQLDLLKCAKSIKSFRVLRKKEANEKIKLRSIFRSLNMKIQLFNSSLPKTSSLPEKRVSKKRVFKDEENLKDQLEDIKKKLEILSK